MRQLSIVCSSFVSKNGLVLCAVSGLLAHGGPSVEPAAASVQDPPAVNTEIVSYGVYDDPTDEQNRKLIYWIVLYLEEDDQNAASVAWSVDRVKIIQFNDPGADKDWIDQSPTVKTGDGLWWVEHADLDDPQPGEFVHPPFIDGTAAFQGSQEEPDLDYEFEGDEPAVLHSWFVHQAYLYLKLSEIGETPPLIEQSEEPVEVDMDGEQPIE